MGKNRFVPIGQKVQFDPFDTINGYGVDACKGDVTGTICEIHNDHKWFRVEFGDKDHPQHTAFKFDDIGKSVILVG